MDRPDTTTVATPARRLGVAASLAAVALLAGACAGDGDDGDGGHAREAIARGEALFDDHCAACHGPQGTGTASGPPLVHEVYEPGHHPDESFQRAVAEGAVQHHWDHGPMPAVPGLERDEVADVIAYVRALQRDAGIID
jgi:mono/diheme cytochrome c family protein